jgi:hypothetical protein
VTPSSLRRVCSGYALPRGLGRAEGDAQGLLARSLVVLGLLGDQSDAAIAAPGNSNSLS